jgi:FlaA1/EpsC-like NDP-sugar epimerase
VIARIPADSGAPSIDWYQFLDRPRLPSPSAESLEPLQQESILVTGAGGSIGSALSLRLSTLGPRRLVLLDASERALFNLQTELTRANPVTNAAIVLANTGDVAHLDEIFAIHQPTLIFHAAAHKHVPLLEEQPLAAIANNTLATRTLADCTQRQRGARLVLLSTDKAVAPASILGATKRIGELITLAAKGVVVRLGNVLGTAGSVVEVFLQQISTGGPVTITDRDAERYFLTCEEAVDLLLESAVATPPRSLVTPDLDRPYSILSLANFLTAASSHKDGLSIAFTTPRPGDKIREAMWSVDERPIVNKSNGHIWIHEQQAVDPKVLGRKLDQLQVAVEHRDLAKALEIVRNMVPDYAPSTTVIALTQNARGVLQT